ncbi:MAG: hypothetical protein KAI99_08720 [Cyclobacteriaceae bacterium]|nr:hypothetical protein [Cyclobacteriaceae bacterium]
MKKSIFIFIAIGFLLSFKTVAQEKEKLFGIKISGFVKNDFIFDTRQIVSARDGHFLLYPLNVKLDMDGEDINAKASFNYLAIQSRLTGKITGPDAFGAKTSGLIEGAFFGHIENNINSFRLRHAYIKLNWKTTEVLFGQYWHLMFVTSCFPGTVSFNTGVPIQFFSRNPQIRISQKLGNITLTGVAATQLDFVSPGGSETLRNAIIPDLSGQISYTSEKLLVGLTAGYKQLLPRLETDNMYKASSTVGGITTQAFFKYVTSPLTIKLNATYAQNGFDGLQIGGYAVKSITDPERDYRDYTTINTIGYWGDFHSNGKKWQTGLFIGYIKNLGSNDVIEAMDLFGTYTRGSDIASVYRVAPRVILNSGKIRFAAEFEHTGSAYGDSISDKGVPQDTKMVINNRLLVAVYYFF